MPRSHSTHTKSMPSHPSSVVPFRNPYSSVGNTSPIHIEQPTLGQSLKQGFGFGAGSAIAHRIFGLSPTLVGQSVSDKKVESTCEKELTAFETCLKSKSSDDFCGEEQINLTRCLQKSPKSTSN